MEREPSTPKLYHEEILKHAKTPKYTSRIKKVDASGYAVNQFCGDEVKVDLSYNNGAISDIYINSIGCSINIASASLMAGELKTLSQKEASALIKTYKSLMNHKTLETDYGNQIGSLSVMESVKAFPIRIKCALLCAQAIEAAVSRIGV